jgi:hypothetical protein
VAGSEIGDASTIGVKLSGFLEVSFASAAVYGIAVLLCIVVALWIAGRGLIRFEPRKFTYSVTLFILLGATGEAFVNSTWYVIFGWPLWEYRLYPTHGGDISLFFPMIWGIFGVYSYMREQVGGRWFEKNSLISILALGAEAILLELFVNVPYKAIFGDYIFYYTPANLGPFSHYSCLQVIPFYAAVSIATRKLTEVQEAAGYQHIRSTLVLYVMVILSFGYI